MWPSYEKIFKLTSFRSTQNIDFAEELEDKYEMENELLFKKNWYENRGGPTEYEMNVMKLYMSNQFEDPSGGLPTTMVEDLKRLPRLSLDSELLLYRGEVRDKIQNRTSSISCDLGDCISSWSLSPVIAMFYAVKININRDSHFQTVNRHQDVDGMRTLFCARVPAGHPFLVMPKRQEGRDEFEILLFEKCHIEHNESAEYPEDVKTILRNSDSKKWNRKKTRQIPFFDDNVINFAGRHQIICGNLTSFGETNDV